MATETFRTLVDMQERSCAEHADLPVFGTKKDGAYTWITYAEFAELVDAFRAGLASVGVKAGDKVAIIANNRVEWAVGAYATYSLGAHYVPMYEAQLPKDWEFILNDSGAVALIVSTEAIYDKVKDWTGELDSLEAIVCLEAPASESYSYARLIELGRDNPVEAADPDPSETAGLIYTSGTTGKPKGVVLSHGNIVSNINAVHEIFPMSSEDRSLSFLPWAHSFGQTVELHCLLSMGASLGIAESVQALMDNFQEVKPTLLFSVPRIFNRIYDSLQKKMAGENPIRRFIFNYALHVAEQRRELADEGKASVVLEWKYDKLDAIVFSKIKARFGGRLRYAFSGGAALSKEVGQFIDDLGILVFEGYGLTETSPIATANRPGARKLGTIGKPVPGVDIYICDEEGGLLADGQDGEIVVVGPNVMQEYHNRPEATESVFFEIDGKKAFKTGDMGRREPDGFIKITGRFKEQYKLENGKYVVPSPLEEQLKLSGYINQACVFGDNKPFNIALVVPDFEALDGWAENHGLSGADHEKLANSPKVRRLILDEIETYGAGFKGYEKPRDIALLTEEFSPENDMLTPTLKLKRRNVIKAYGDVIEGLYPKD